MDRDVGLNTVFDNGNRWRIRITKVAIRLHHIPPDVSVQVSLRQLLSSNYVFTGHDRR